MQRSFSSSTVSLPAEGSTKSKGGLMRRITLKPKKSLSVATGTNYAASQSTTTLSSAPSTPSKSRRAFDLFSTLPSRKSGDASASMPSTPRTPKTARSFAGPSTRSTTASLEVMRNHPSSSRFGDAPPVPAVPKMFLISDEVFVIASAPKEEAAVAGSRSSQSSTSPSYYSTMSSTSSRSSTSWVDNLGASPMHKVAALPALPTLEPEPHRSSLDDIDDQMVLNLCMNLCDEQKPAKSTAHDSPRDRQALDRSVSLGSRDGATPTLPASLTSHTRIGSAPHSLGPLPPQPSMPPTEAVLRKTDNIKKRYSKQGSPLTDTSSFTFPRPAPGTPKLDSISSLKSLEAGLSLDSKLAKRNHRRSSSKHSSKSSVDFHYANVPVKLTRGHVATTSAEPQEQLASRFSEDSESGEEARRLFGILTPVLGSVAKMPLVFSSSSTPQMSAMDYCRWDGSATPDMLATRSSSSSSNSSLSDLSDVTTHEEPVFDLSRPDLDYATVYAMAQRYAKTAAPVVAKKSPMRSKPQPGMLGLLTPATRSQKHLPDPIDRSYHLRK